MTRDDIVRMAQEAAIMPPNWGATENQWRTLHDFAALVAAAEREKVARWQIGSGYATGHGDTIEDLLVELEWQVREAEREACAKVCDELAAWDKLSNYYAVAAKAIRARGKE